MSMKGGATGVGCQRAGSADAARVEDLKKDAAFRQWIGLAVVYGAGITGFTLVELLTIVNGVYKPTSCHSMDWFFGLVEGRIYRKLLDFMGQSIQDLPVHWTNPLNHPVTRWGPKGPSQHVPTIPTIRTIPTMMLIPDADSATADSTWLCFWPGIHCQRIAKLVYIQLRSIAMVYGNEIPWNSIHGVNLNQ